jgi:integrase/recombinase XerD
MLEHFFELEFKVLRLRNCAAGEHLDSFAGWLRSTGYRRRPGQLLLRGAAHFSEWASLRGIAWNQIDQHVIEGFGLHLPTCGCTHAFQGRDPYNLEGAKRFIEDLRRRGILPPAEIQSPHLPEPVEAFSNWMRLHRGATENTIRKNVSIVAEFVAAVGEDTARYDAALARHFILAKAAHVGRAHTQSVVSAIRVFLRFLANHARCSADLAAAVPSVARWRLSSLPRYISAEDIECLIASCDAATAGGARDRAIVLLLARLALRAADVRDLRLSDVDWRQARLRVSGKGRSETWLPLPQDAGDAILYYLEHFRPRVANDHVFLRVRPPFSPLPSSGPISRVVRRAIERSGIQTPSMGAHLLRHSSATAMLRDGTSLDVIAAVLRHRSIESTAHYAKVDLRLLRSVVQPWPGRGGSPC